MHNLTRRHTFANKSQSVVRSTYLYYQKMQLGNTNLSSMVDIFGTFQHKFVIEVLLLPGTCIMEMSKKFRYVLCKKFANQSVK